MESRVQKRSRLCALLLPLMLCVLWQAAAKKSNDDYSHGTYVAILTGDQMTPPVTTTAHGEADFVVHHKKHKKEKTDTVTYNITIIDVNHLVEVDMRQGPPGASGDKIATLYGPETSGAPQPVNGLLKAGNLTSSEFMGPMAGKDAKDLVQRIKDDDVYVLVTITDHPDGLLRGQVHQKNTTSP